MLLFFVSFFVVFGLANFYIARRVWQGTEILPRYIRIIIITAFILSAASYPAARGLLGFNNWVYDLVLGIGALHFVNLLYAFLLILTLDIFRLIFRKKYEKIKREAHSYSKLKGFLSLTATVLVTSLVVYGHFNSLDIKLKYADFVFPTGSGKGSEYKIALFSDSHFSSLNAGRFSETLVQKLNEINPDIVLIAGDVIDDKSQVLYRKNIHRLLSEINPPKGIFISNGNHEYIVGISDAEKFFDSIKFRVLKDDFVVIDSTFIVAGRDDSSKVRFTGLNRKTLREILAPAKSQGMPIFLLDHQPFNLSEAANENISFQFSGHTHNGQFIPINLITNLIYEVSWGYKKIKNTHYYISCGVGTWGPPVRIGSDSELIVLNVKFN